MRFARPGFWYAVLLRMIFPVGRLLALGAPLLLTGCATVGPPQPPSLDLPRPPSDLRAIRKGDHVTLTWTIPTVTTDRQTIGKLGATRICRGLEPQLKECGTPVGEAAAPAIPASVQASKEKPSAAYSDTVSREIQSDDPSALISYAVEVLNTDGRAAGLSNEVRVPLLRTEPPPSDFRARVIKAGVALSWSRNLPRQSQVRFVYRVYRRLEDGPQWNLVGEFPPGAESTEAVTDSNIEWEKTYGYRINTVTVAARNGSELKVEGNDSPEIRVFADDVFPPAVPSGLQAVFSGPGQNNFIDLIWAPVPDVDLDGYNVYRREEEGTPTLKLNAKPVKTPAYRDQDVISGKHYFYSISAVDLRGNESAHSEEAEERVP
jgi:hypothetical protein